MPEFSFICNECGTRKTEFVKRHVDLIIPCCLNCTQQMSRDFHADAPNVPAGGYCRAIHSDSLAVAPSQRGEHERLFPYITLDNKCRPVFDNYTDHQRYLDETGFVKNRAKQRRRLTKV